MEYRNAAAARSSILFFRACPFLFTQKASQKTLMYSDFRVKTNSFQLCTKVLPRRGHFCACTKVGLTFVPMPPSKSGRPPKDPSVPPMPAGWKNTERLAVCLAYLEASEGGSTDAGALENATCRNYAAQLQHVHDNVAEFEPSSHRWSGHTLTTSSLSRSPKPVESRAHPW